MSKDILRKAKGRVVKLSDGKDYTLAPFNLNTLAGLEDAFDCTLSELQEKLNGRTATAFRKLLLVLLSENYPGMTLEQAGSLVEMDILGGLLEAMGEALRGIEVKE